MLRKVRSLNIKYGMNGGGLIQYFIPCYRRSDNVIGFYDLVNDVFYTNAGSGTFSKGPNVY